MIKRILGIVILMVTILFSNKVNAQSFARLDKSPMDVSAYPSSYRISDKLVKVIYSRPQLRRRTVSKLAPNKKVWRTGANEAAEITFYKDVNFGGKEVKSGTYTLFTIPGDKQWTVILSTAKNVWGAYSYNESEDVVRVSASVSKSKNSIEAFSIAFTGEENNATMYLGWGKLIVSVPVKG